MAAVVAAVVAGTERERMTTKEEVAQLIFEKLEQSGKFDALAVLSEDKHVVAVDTTDGEQFFIEVQEA